MHVKRFPACHRKVNCYSLRDVLVRLVQERFVTGVCSEIGQWQLQQRDYKEIEEVVLSRLMARMNSPAPQDGPNTPVKIPQGKVEPLQSLRFKGLLLLCPETWLH